MNTLRLPSLLVLLIASLLASGGCEAPATQAGPQPQSLPTTQVVVGSKTYTLEIADEDEERQMGLMHRDAMPADRGMIFVFPDEAPRGFWMKNTRIPLDILYLDRHGRVVSAHRMEPFDLRSTPSEGPAKYAIELNAGELATTGLRRGDTIHLPLEARYDAAERPATGRP
jgi:uncharacterized membrane protein (UPF0127 family)